MLQRVGGLVEQRDVRAHDVPHDHQHELRKDARDHVEDLAAVGAVQFVIVDYIYLDSQAAAGFDLGVVVGQRQQEEFDDLMVPQRGGRARRVGRRGGEPARSRSGCYRTGGGGACT